MIFGDTYWFPESRCLGCGKQLDAATPYGDNEKPAPGAIMICLDCGHIMVLDERLQHREPTDEEIIEIAGDQQIIDAQRIRAGYLRFRDRKRRRR